LAKELRKKVDLFKFQPSRRILAATSNLA
jgi:hypothetical protein